MKIYVTHSRKYDYKNGLYLPIRQSHLNAQHEFILPHEFTDEPFPSRELILNGNLGMILAEVSTPSTPQGIELGWANSKEVPIAFLHQPGAQPSNALGKVSDFFAIYCDNIQLINGISTAIKWASKKRD
jgi:hypothetical protein